MRVIRPFDVVPAMIVQSSAVEQHAEYSAATTYALDARCTIAATGRLYQCIQGPALGRPPATSPLYWVDVGPTNKMAMFDSQIGTPTVATDSLTVTIATGMIDSVALVGVTAQTARVVARDGNNGPVIYDSAQTFSGDIPSDWYQYFFFDPYSARTLGLWRNIPPYQSTHVTVTLTGAGEVSLGSVVVGLSSDIGQVEAGASAGIVDYSKKSTNVRGETSFAKGNFSKRLSVNLFLDRAQMNRVQRTLYGLRATPAVWVASDEPELEEAAVVYGFYRDFSASISYPNTVLYTLEIEGLI